MGKSNTVQTDFLAGEISPRMEMQDNLEGRKHGVELMENFFPHLQGSSETSRGLEYIGSIDGFSGRLFGFPVALLTSFMVVVAGGKLKVMGSNGIVMKGDVLSNSDFNEKGADWTASSSLGSSAVFLRGGVVLSGGYLKNTSVSITQMVLGTVTSASTLDIEVASGGPLSVRVGILEGLADLADEVIYGVGSHTITGIVSPSEVWVEITLEAGDEDTVVSGVHLYDPSFGEFSFTVPWTTPSDVESMQALMIPGEEAMILTSSTYLPYKLSRSTAGIWTLAALALTGRPAEWSDSNYPQAVGFFGGRMWLGGVASDSSVIYGSKPLLYGDFSLGDGTLADDAIELRLSRQGAIVWIAGGTGLLVGTSNSEHVISGSIDILVPGDVSSKVQSTNGSYPTQSLEVGNEVMYISPDGRKLRSLGFEWLKDAWRSRDITYASEHITDNGNALTHLNYAANPDSLIVGTTKLGTLVNATYEPYSQTAGFSRRSTQGRIASVGTVAFSGSDEVWMLVDKGDGSMLIGRERHPHNIKLDNHTIFTSGTLISGGTAPHLATRTCQVLVDGAVHPDVIPGAGGVFTTEYSGYEIIIGLKIQSLIKTLPVADKVDRIGTTRPMNKRFTEIYLRILDSWRPKINGRRTPNRRAATPMGEAEPAITETMKVSNEGWDMDAQIIIEQDLPLRTEISGWFGRIIQEEI